MKNDLGEIFLDGKIISLKNTDIDSLQDMLVKVRNDKLEVKEKIESIVDEMSEI